MNEEVFVEGYEKGYFVKSSVCLHIFRKYGIKNILRLVVKKSPTGENTHYFFFMLK